MSCLTFLSHREVSTMADEAKTNQYLTRICLLNFFFWLVHSHFHREIIHAYEISVIWGVWASNFAFSAYPPTLECGFDYCLGLNFFGLHRTVFSSKHPS